MKNAIVSIFDRLMFTEDIDFFTCFTGEILVVEFEGQTFYFKLISGKYIKTSDFEYDYQPQVLPSVKLIEKNMADFWIKESVPTYCLSWKEMVDPFTSPYAGSVWTIVKALIEKNKSSS